MKSNSLNIIAGLVLMLATSFQTAGAQTAAQKVSAKEASLIAHLVKETNQPDWHSADEVYLSVTIGKTEYIAELKSGKVVSRKNAQNSSGGFSGAYAEVSLMPLNKNREEIGQGSGQILRSNGNTWKRIAINETDYQCSDVKSVPKSVLKALDVECF